MSNIFSQPGLGQLVQGQQEFYSRQQKEKLNRDLLRAQADQYRAKIQQMGDPSYGQPVAPSGVREFQYYQGLTPEQQKSYLGVKRATPEEALMRKGVTIDPMTGRATPIGGFGQALGDIEAQQIETQTPAEVSRAGALGAERAAITKRSELKERMAMLPELETTVSELSKLGKVATYTKTGQAKDALAREMGMEPSEGAVARTAYMAMVDNQVLPLLKQTFGAAFTVQEGERLRNTLGDPDKSPKEKDFILKAFIKQKKKDIKSLKRELGVKKQPASEVIDYTEYFR